MKTAVVIRDGMTQIVLTPESELDKRVVEIVAEKAWPAQQKQTVQATLMRGSFYETNGGWYREGSTESSLIIRVDKEVPEMVEVK